MSQSSEKQGFFFAFWCQIAPEKIVAKKWYKKWLKTWMKSPKKFKLKKILDEIARL